MKEFVYFDVEIGEFKKMTLQEVNVLIPKFKYRYPVFCEKHQTKIYFDKKLKIYIYPVELDHHKVRSELFNNFKIEDEIFKKIAGFEGYSISNYGRVLNNKNNKLLLPIRNRTNRHRCAVVNVMCVDGKRKVMRVHTLMDIAFGISGKGTCIVHKDGNYMNNKIGNLMKSNRDYLTRRLQVAKHIYVAQLDPKTGDVIEVYPSVKEANAKFFVDTAISNCLNGRSKTSCGFKWRYATENEYLQFG